MCICFPYVEVTHFNSSLKSQTFYILDFPVFTRQSHHFLAMCSWQAKDKVNDAIVDSQLYLCPLSALDHIWQSCVNRQLGNHREICRNKILKDKFWLKGAKYSFTLC